MYFIKRLLFTAIIFAIPALAWASGGEAELAPSAVLPLDRFEFEKVVDGVEVHHSFVIQNKGSAPLNIDRIKTG
jgi:hypothetical protein